MFLKLSLLFVAALVSAGDTSSTDMLLSANATLAGHHHRHHRGGGAEKPVDTATAVAATEVKEKAVVLIGEIVASPVVSHQKRHTYSRNGNSIDVKKSRRCMRKKRGGGCKKNRRKSTENRARKFCHKREKKCRNRMSDTCRRDSDCSRKTNRRCHRKYTRCLLGNDRPIPRGKQRSGVRPNGMDTVKVPARSTEPEIILKHEKEECTANGDCIDGLCCAQHGNDRRICKSYTKKDQICTRRFDRKRSIDIYERCACEVGLKCLPDSALEHHYTCQGT